MCRVCRRAELGSARLSSLDAAARKFVRARKFRVRLCVCVRALRPKPKSESSVTNALRICPLVRLYRCASSVASTTELSSALFGRARDSYLLRPRPQTMRLRRARRASDCVALLFVALRTTTRTLYRRNSQVVCSLSCQFDVRASERLCSVPFRSVQFSSVQFASTAFSFVVSDAPTTESSHTHTHTTAASWLRRWRRRRLTRTRLSDSSERFEFVR